MFFLKKTTDTILQKVKEKVFSLLETTDLILFVVDGKVGITEEDRQTASYIHKLSKTNTNLSVILVINKSDVNQNYENMYQFDALGFQNKILISAQHGTSINQLLDKIVEQIGKITKAPVSEPKFKVAFIGKPNVGKSSLMNLILNKERVLVSEQAGTTREAISEIISFYKEDILITDTPGIKESDLLAVHWTTNG